MKSLKLIIVIFLSLFTFSILAEEKVKITEQSNLMLVVRTSLEANKLSANLVPTGPISVQDDEGKTHTLEMAHYEYLGDTHIRFVFDSTETMANATPEEFSKFKLTAEEAVNVAISNIYRDYGQPKMYKLEHGVYQVQGESPDFDSSYFLDKSLWKNVNAHFKDSIIVAVPARHLLLLAPATDKKAVSFLAENVQSWFKESGSQGVSSALYTYNSGEWTVYQPPLLKQ